MRATPLISAVALLVGLVFVYNQAIGDNPAPTAKAVSSDTSACAKSAQCPKADKSCAKEWKKRCQEKANATNCAQAKSACDKKPAGCSKKAQANASRCSKAKSACGPKPSGCSEKAQANASQCSQAKSACGTKPAGCSKKAQAVALNADSCKGKDPSRCCPKTN